MVWYFILCFCGFYALLFLGVFVWVNFIRTVEVLDDIEESVEDSEMVVLGAFWERHVYEDEEWDEIVVK